VNWNALGAVGELVGALAVVVSLLYVARQIRQSTAATKAASFQSMTETMVHINTSVLLDAPTYDLMIRALASESLTEVERARYLVFFWDVLRMLESAHYQVELGVLDESKLLSIAGNMQSHLKCQVGAEAWSVLQTRYPPEFRSVVSDLAARDLPTLTDVVQRGRRPGG
jgi:hypothetical protein